MKTSQLHRSTLVVSTVTGLALLVAALGLPGAAMASGPELAAVTAEAPRLLQRLEAARVRSVAVVDFTDLRGRPTELGRFLAEKLSGELANGKTDVRVIDRLNLAALLKEHKLQASGLTDPDALHTVARIAGVEALITGRMTPLGDRVQVTLLAIQTEKARILASDDVEIPRTPTIADLERRALGGPLPSACDAPELVLEGPPGQSVEKQDLQFVIHGCRWAEGSVECGVAVRNLSDERNLLLSGKSRLVFGEGTQATASRVFLNGEWATGALSRVGSPLLPGVRSTLGAVFEGVPESVETLRLLVLDFYGFEVRFSDIPLER